MRRADLAHLLRAAGQILNADWFIVIGSAALLGSFPETTISRHELTLSVEADLLPPDFSDASADLIDGALGQDSMFDHQHGYHADGISLNTAVPPPGWPARLVPFCPAGSNGVVGWCLERHDLVLAKLVAGREKDLQFAKAAVTARLVSPAVLATRADYRSGLAGRVGRLPQVGDGVFDVDLDLSGMNGDLIRPVVPGTISETHILDPDLELDL